MQRGDREVDGLKERTQSTSSFPTHTSRALHTHRGYEEEEAQEAAGGRDGRHAHGGSG